MRSGNRAAAWVGRRRFLKRNLRLCRYGNSRSDFTLLFGGDLIGSRLNTRSPFSRTFDFCFASVIAGLDIKIEPNVNRRGDVHMIRRQMLLLDPALLLRGQPFEHFSKMTPQLAIQAFLQHLGMNTT